GYYNEIVTHGAPGYPNDNAGKPVPSIVGLTNGLIPKGAKNVAVAREFLKYFIQPKVIGEFVELGLGRWLPVMPSLAKSSFWQDPKDPHLWGYVQQGLLGPTIRWRTLSRSLRGGLKGGEYAWAVAFVVPYVAVFLAFVAYPVVYGLWMGSEASLYRELFADPIYQSTVVNTVPYLALGVNVKMFLALLLSGFFMRPGRWMKVLLLIFVLPWAVPQISTFISIHWMLNGEWGFLNNVLYALFHVEGPHWLNDRWTALGAVIVSHIWKWTPFWTL